MHLGPEAGVDSPHGATRKLIDTNLSVPLLLVLQLERFGASTTGDGGCFDFRMGVQFFSRTCILDDIIICIGV